MSIVDPERKGGGRSPGGGNARVCGLDGLEIFS